MSKMSSWRLWYLVFAIGYICWVVYLGVNDFGRIHRDYRRALYGLNADQIEKSAIDELSRECLKKSGKINQTQEQCLSHPAAEVQAKIESLTKQRTKNMEQARKKRTMFYLFFVLFFIVVPLAILYGVLFLLINLFTTVKVVK